MSTKEYNRAYYQANREKILAKMREQYQADPESGKAKSRARYQKNRPTILADRRKKYADMSPQEAQEWRATARANALKYGYGITVKEYERLLAKQHHACAICKKPDNTKTGKPRRLAVDHDHKTGTIRGLLCFRCNLHIGFLEDDKKVKKMLRYLQRSVLVSSV